VSLWEAVLPAEVLRLPEELARVDALLDDPVFFVPFLPFFDPRVGRPSTPMETYLRMMFLKFRYRLGYESLCREVSDSHLAAVLPDPDRRQRPAPDDVDEADDPLRHRSGAGLQRGSAGQGRAGKAATHHPVARRHHGGPGRRGLPDRLGLLAKAVRRIAAGGRRVQAAGGATRTRLRDRSRSAGKRAHGIAAKLRLRSAQGKQEAQATVRRITGELACLAERAVADANALLAGARRALCRAQAKAETLAASGSKDAEAGRRRGRLRRAVNDLTELLEVTRRIAGQTRQRLSGGIPPGATRRVSLHDGDARPIAKGQLGKPVQFGYKAQVVDNDDGVVLDHALLQGNPADAPQLAPAVERVIARTGCKPRTVTADRGYGEASVDEALHDLGVRNVVIPRKGKPGKARQAAEHRPAFRKSVKWRTGSEGRISSLKRGYGWDRTRIDGTAGAQIWTG
jgi:IS5 family transposase